MHTSLIETFPLNHKSYQVVFKEDGEELGKIVRQNKNGYYYYLPAKISPSGFSGKLWKEIGLTVAELNNTKNTQ